MRASTLFGLTIAILIGMAVVFGVKSAGLFDRKAPAVQSPERPRILVAQRNLFADVTTMANDVFVRVVSDEEMDQYLKNKHKYMTPVEQAAHLRILARNVHANEPLLKEHFLDLALPESFKGLLDSGMRAVNVLLPKDRAAGGVIRKGDIVDVYLTTTICSDGNCSRPFTATAPIAFGLKVVGKRDSIWTMNLPVPDGQPLSFTLQANPYRAALLDFAKNKGYLTLVPNGPSSMGKPVSILNDGKDEEQRVINISQGQPITDQDMEEIFKLAPLNRAQSNPVIERWSGISHRGDINFPGSGGNSIGGNMPGVQPRTDGRAPLGYQFQNPGGCAPTAVADGTPRRG